VTPYVIADDTIQMIVAPEVSTVTGFTAAVRGSFPNPIISRRNANTVVNVRSGSTYVIGGLLSNNEIEDVTKIPLLGDVPLLGALFRSTRLRRQYTQLVFFITPRIIGAAGEAGRIIVPPSR
jgi:pilus assembly protein CpaC